MIRKTYEEKPKVSLGDTRIIRKYLWLPLRINNEKRWLETVNIKQKVVRGYHGDTYSLPHLEWENDSWC